MTQIIDSPAATNPGPGTPCGCLVSSEVIDQSIADGALTYRQLDYWIRMGWLPAHTHEGGRVDPVKRTVETRRVESSAGSGVVRGFDPLDATRAAIAAVYVREFPGLRPDLALQLVAEGRVTRTVAGWPLITLEVRHGE